MSVHYFLAYRPVLKRCHAGLYGRSARNKTAKKKKPTPWLPELPDRLEDTRSFLVGFRTSGCQVIDRRLPDTFGKGTCQIEFAGYV